MSEENSVQDFNVKLLNGDVSIVKTGFPNPVMLGLELNYDIVVTNNTVPGEVINVVVEDIIDPNLAFVKAGVIDKTITTTYVNGLLSCNLGAINPLETITLNVTVIPKIAGTVTNQATAKATALSGDMDYPSNTVTITIVDVVTEVGNIKTTVDNTATKVDGLTTAVNGITTTVNSIATEVGNVKTTVDSTSTRVDGLTTAVNGITTTVNNTAMEVGNIKNTVDGTAIAVNNIGTTVTSTAVAVSNVQTTVDNTATKVDVLTTAVNGITTTVNSIATEVGNVKTTVDNTAVIVNNTATAVISTETKVDGLTTTVNGMSTIVGNTATDVGDIKATVDSTSTKVDNLTIIDTETNIIVKAIQQEIGGIVNPGNYNLTTGIVIKDYAAKSVVVAVENTTSLPISIVISLIDHTKVPFQVINKNITVAAKNRKSFVLGEPALEYEVLFNGMSEGLYAWTATRINTVFDSLGISQFISSNTFRHSELVMIKPVI